MDRLGISKNQPRTQLLQPRTMFQSQDLYSPATVFLDGSSGAFEVLRTPEQLKARLSSIGFKPGMRIDLRKNIQLIGDSSGVGGYYVLDVYSKAGVSGTPSALFLVDDSIPFNALSKIIASIGSGRIAETEGRKKS